MASMILNNVKQDSSHLLDIINLIKPESIYLVGIAIDFCVFNTANDIQMQLAAMKDSNDGYEPSIEIVHDLSRPIFEDKRAEAIAGVKERNDKLETIEWSSIAATFPDLRGDSERRRVVLI